MRRRLWVATLCLALIGVLGLFWSNATAASGASSDEVKLARLVTEMKSMRSGELDAMESIAIRRWEVPGPGVDVMRAQLEETYSVDGVGTDTVQLSGWIAVRHGKAYPVEGSVDLNWNTAILDTQFVEMDLHGDSKLFGPVHVTLDRSRPSLGKVGRIEIPELAAHALEARLEKNDAAQANERALSRKREKPTPATAKPKAQTGNATTKTEAGATRATPGTEAVPAACEGPIFASVSMPKLGIEMATKEAVIWYSLVDTIPPVGHTASVSVKPVRLVMNGREVATLETGIVKFREVVRHVGLSSDDEQLASTK